MVIDWMNTTAEERFPGLTVREPGQLPITFLLDGRGKPKVFRHQTSLANLCFVEQILITV
jgi:hypothetical protein